VPCLGALLGLSGGLDLPCGSLSLADDIGECIQDGLWAGALGRVLGQQRLDQTVQRAGVLRRAGGRVRMAPGRAGRLVPSNGGAPSTAVYKVAPSAHMSAQAWLVPNPDRR
jgi:hypothetical protein